MAVNLWGRDPSGKARAYVIHISTNDIDHYKAKARDEGWTDLTTGKWEDSSAQDESSDSSAEPSSPITKSTRSRVSAR